MNWLRRWEIARLKRRARRAHYTMHGVLGSMDCGRQLASVISSDYRRAEIEWKRCIARLREIAPDFPAGVE